MRFFGREDEIAELRRIRMLSHDTARLTVVTGRRRVGKTELVKQALKSEDDLFVYLLITRQKEATLCDGLQHEIESTGISVLGKAQKFTDLLRIVFKAAIERPVTLVIDEFQEFDRINPAVFGEMQGLWDEFQHVAKINLVVCGSVNRLMNKIFFNYGEPLYGRNTGHLKLRPFRPSVLKEILASYKSNYTPDDLLALWTFTGGVARYVQLLLDGRALSRKAMLDYIFSPSSPFIEEGKTLLAEEFGGEYGTFFSILSSVASGHNTFGELSSCVGADVGTYLARLEGDYGILGKIVPAYDKDRSRNSHYVLEDCFLRFWFRFVFKYRSWIEMERTDELKAHVSANLRTFEGFALERYFRAKFVEEKRYTSIGGWWDRKGENEIDLVCEDELTGSLDIYEVKREAKRYDENALKLKAEAFFAKNPAKRELKVSYAGLSLEDV